MVLWEDLGGIVGIREAEGHPSLFAKGFAGRPFLMVGERGIGYCAALRDADPFVATGLPANLQHELRGSFVSEELATALRSVTPIPATRRGGPCNRRWDSNCEAVARLPLKIKHN